LVAASSWVVAGNNPVEDNMPVEGTEDKIHVLLVVVAAGPQDPWEVHCNIPLQTF